MRESLSTTYYSKWLSFYISAECWKGIAPLTLPRNLSLYIEYCFSRAPNLNTPTFSKEYYVFISLAPVPPGNCAGFESQFLVEFDTQRAKNVTDNKVSQVL